MTSDYYKPFPEIFEETSFEESNIELYQKKQNFRTVSPW